jgi:glycerol kinase
MLGIVAVDIGSTSMRAILYDTRGRAIHMDSRPCGPRFFPDGRVEQDAATWQAVLLDILKSSGAMAAAKGLELQGIAVTAQRSSVLPVDATGQPLHPAIMWQDNRSAGLAASLHDCQDSVYRKTGLKISPVFSAVKMTWLHRNRPELWARTYKMLGVQDWVIYLLTGRFVTDHSFGSRTNLLHLEKRCWDPELLALFEVPRAMLCDLVAPGSIVGGLTPGLADGTGLAVGLPVISAAGDQQCAALGLGLFTGERAVANTGTGSFLIGHSEKPALDADMRLSCNVSAVPDAYIVEAAVLTSGAVLQWFKELLSGPGSADASFDALIAQAGDVPAGANGVLLLPHFKGCGSPHWDPDARGVLFNLSLSTTRGVVARAILEGIAFELKENLELVEKLCGTVAAVSVSGGMTRAALFNQVQSDVFERSVVRLGGDEATSQGAWIAAAVALGIETSHAAAFARIAQREPATVFEPDPRNRAMYRQQRQCAQALFHALSAAQFRDSAAASKGTR